VGRRVRRAYNAPVVRFYLDGQAVHGLTLGQHGRLGWGSAANWAGQNFQQGIDGLRRPAQGRSGRRRALWRTSPPNRLHLAQTSAHRTSPWARSALETSGFPGTLDTRRDVLDRGQLRDELRLTSSAAQARFRPSQPAPGEACPTPRPGLRRGGKLSSTKNVMTITRTNGPASKTGGGHGPPRRACGCWPRPRTANPVTP